MYVIYGFFFYCLLLVFLGFFFVCFSNFVILNFLVYYIPLKLALCYVEQE